jgi:predicted nucleic acid-binding protein
MVLLDTNLVSELRKVRSGKADPGVAAWAERVDAASLFLSAISLHELELGVRLMERRDAAQGALLRQWLEDCVLPAFDGRILPVDVAVARRSAAWHGPDPHPFPRSMSSCVPWRVGSRPLHCVPSWSPPRAAPKAQPFPVGVDAGARARCPHLPLPGHGVQPAGLSSAIANRLRHPVMACTASSRATRKAAPTCRRRMAGKRLISGRAATANNSRPQSRMPLQ